MKINAFTFEPDTSALDFAPEILAIEKRPPSPMPRAVLYTLLVLLAILLVWSLIGKLDIVATAQGKLVPETYVKIVQPAEAGVIKEILVTEGDRVHAGQVLLRLDTTASSADAAIVAKEVELRRLQVRRIDAELSGKSMTRCGSSSSDALPRNAGEGEEGGESCIDGLSLFREVEAQSLAKQRAYRDTLDAERALLAQAEEDLLGAQAQAVKLEKLLPILTEEAKSLGELAQQGLVPKFQSSEKQREQIETEQNLASQQRTVMSLKSRIAESRSRVARVTSEYRQQLLSERVESQAALDKAQQELAKQEHRGRLTR